MKIRDRERKLIKRALMLGMVTGVLLGAAGGGAAGWMLGKTGRAVEKEDPGSSDETENAPEMSEGQETQQTQELNLPSDPEGGAAEPVDSPTEDWRLLLVNDVHPLDAAYEPQLAELLPERMVDARILESTQQMLSDAKAAGLDVYVVSSYRSYEDQCQVFNETMQTWIGQGYTPLEAYEETKKSVAVPGTSEHATGLALDITSALFTELDERQAETAEAQWLAQNCWRYGFILRYPPEKASITGIIYEPWHYRYVGEEAAQQIMAQGITLEEYLGED